MGQRREARTAVVGAEAPAADVSVLIALRALAARDRGVEDVSRAEWLTAVREEMLRWYGPARGHTEESRSTGGIHQDPSVASFPGQCRRMARLKPPSGGGSQFTSMAALGSSRWIRI